MLDRFPADSAAIPENSSPAHIEHRSSQATIGGQEAKDENAVDPKLSTPSSQTSRNAPRTRKNWISNLSAKFSSSSNNANVAVSPPAMVAAASPPNATNMANSDVDDLHTTLPTQASPKTGSSPPRTAVLGGSKLDRHNPFGAAYSPKDKEEEERGDTVHSSAAAALTSTSPKGPSFLTNALRRLSSGQGGAKAATNGHVCERRVMNVDSNRDRCKVPGLDQGKLRRVAFCVDVEIAGVASREFEDDEDEVSPSDRHPQPIEQQKHQRQHQQSLDGGKRKHHQRHDTKAKRSSNDSAVSADLSEAVKKDEADLSLGSSPGEAKVAGGEVKEHTRKQEKKKRSEEERKERKEKRRKNAEANGVLPLILNGDDDDPADASSLCKPQIRPVTDPVRIYRRCCKLRESPVLKRVVDQISLPSSTLAESPGTVGVLDLSKFPMTQQDVATFSDWLAIVPVRKLILEDCRLNDASVRAILSALLATKTVEQMRSRRKRRGKVYSTSAWKEEKYGVVEKVSFKDNARIGPEGWRHISLFIHMSRSLKAIDLTGVPFPKAYGSASSNDVVGIFANSLASRFGCSRLEELLLSECDPSTEDVRKICDGAIAVGLRRLGLANSGLTREGFGHVVRFFAAGKCEGLDLGGNHLCDHLDLFIPALEKNRNLYALSLADCSLTPQALRPLLQALVSEPKLYFVDFSHNSELFSGVQDALATLRGYLPKMPWLKRIHLADVNMTPDHAIALAEVLSECPKLCHLNILENPAIVRLASAKDPSSQEEACALYASLMAAVRVSRTIVALDIEVPGEESSEVVKALASQIVAYSLRNLEHGMEEGLPHPADSSVVPQVPIPGVLQHLVGQVDEGGQDERAPDEDYVIGGTGVVKALGVCLGTIDNVHGDVSVPASGASTPVRMKHAPVVSQRPRDMSKNLLDTARNIRTRIQCALVKEDRAGNDINYSMHFFLPPYGLSYIRHTNNLLLGRLQFLDFTLHRIIRRFEDQFPETRIASQQARSPVLVPSSHPSSDDLQGEALLGSSVCQGNHHDNGTGADDEDHEYLYGNGSNKSLSRSSSVSRIMTSEEGQIHRLGQNLRRDFLSPSLERAGSGGSQLASSVDDAHIVSLHERLEQLHEEQVAGRPSFETVDANKAMEGLGWTVDELWNTQKQDREAFARFKQSQIAAQINSGARKPFPSSHQEESGEKKPEA